MFPTSNQVPYGYLPCFNYFAYDHNYGYMGPVPPEHNFYRGNADLRVPPDFVNRPANQITAYTMGIPTIPSSPSCPVNIQSNEPPISSSCPEPPVEKTEIDIQVENFMREYFIHKAEREAEKAKKKNVTKSQRGRKNKATKCRPVTNKATANPNSIAHTEHSTGGNTIQCDTPQNKIDVRPIITTNGKDIEFRGPQSATILPKISHDFTNIPLSFNNAVLHKVNIVEPQIFGAPKDFHQGPLVDVTMEIPSQKSTSQALKNFTSCLMGRSNDIGVCGESAPMLDPQISFAAKQEILQENCKIQDYSIPSKPPGKVVFSATRTKLEAPVPSHSSGEDSGRYTNDSKEQRSHLDLDNEMLRNAIQYGPQPRLNKYTFLVDDWISEDYTMEAIDSSDPIVRVSRAKFNWIFVDHPQMSRKFQRCGDSTEIDSTMDSQRIEKQYVSTQRHKNRITKAIADIEEFITKMTTLEKVHLINRYRAFKDLLTAALGDVDSMHS